MHLHAYDLADLAAIAYFAGFGLALLAKPSLVNRFGLEWTDRAGQVEVRCYYGAVSIGTAAFLAYLLSRHAGLDALTGVFILATAVFSTRLVATAIDGAWSHAYTRMALPVECGFVIFLGVARFAFSR
jgi:hypothetical protein